MVADDRGGSAFGWARQPWGFGGSPNGRGDPRGGGDQPLSDAPPVIRLLHSVQERAPSRIGHVAVQRMDNVGIVVENLPTTIAFFRELGLELEGQGTIEGEWSGRVTGLPGQRVEVAMMRTPDGHS